MSKRKANALAGSESVDEWLNSSHRPHGYIEASKGGPGVGGTDLGIAAVVERNHPTVVPAEANWLNPLPLPVEAGSDCGGSGGSRGEGPADKAVPPQTSEEDGPADPNFEELGPRTEAAVEAFWALLNELGYEPLYYQGYPVEDRP